MHTTILTKASSEISFLENIITEALNKTVLQQTLVLLTNTQFTLLVVVHGVIQG
jgi:hypothetical protein